MYKTFSILAGIIVFLFFFGLKALNPTNIDWLMNGDSGLYYVSWKFLRNAPWSFPLGFIPDLIHPLGTSIANQDGIPVLALIFKLTSGLLPQEFNYFGYWILLGFVLQGLIAFLILRYLTHNERASFVGSLFFVISPYFLHRYQLTHIALGTHWLILLGFYFFLQEEESEKRLAKLVALNVAAVFIHPYLSVLVFCISLASIFYREKLKLSLGYSLLLLILTGLCFMCLGYLDAFGVEAFGFGKYSADLLTLFNSMGRGFLPGISINHDQYEGFGYLGFGMIVILGISIWFREVAMSTFPKSFFILGLLSLLMFLFSLSSIVTVAGFKVIDLSGFYSLIEPIPSALRASGRFVGPLHYWIFIFSIVVLIRKFPKKASLMLLVLFGVQVADLSIWFFKRGSWGQEQNWNRIDSDRWSELLRGKEHLYLVPIPYENINCYGLPVSQEGFERNDFLSFAVLAANHKVTINGGIDPRGDYVTEAKICSGMQAYFKSQDLPRNTLYVVHGKFFETFHSDTGGRLSCETIDSFQACSVP